MSGFHVGDVIYDRKTGEQIAVTFTSASTHHWLSCGCHRVEYPDGTEDLGACADHRVVTGGNDAD